MRAAGVAIALALAVAHARAAPSASVVVFGTDAAPASPGFVQALSIELVDRATVTTGGMLAGAGIPERLDGAFVELGARGATIGVWIDTASADRRTYDLVLYAVGRRRDIALLKVARVEVGPDDDVDRTLALKVGDFLDELLRDPAAVSIIELPRAPVIDETPPPPPSSPPPPPPPPPVIRRPTIGPLVDLGAGIAVGGAATQGALVVDVGLLVRRGRWSIEPALGVRIPSGIEQRSMAGTVWATERTIVAGVRVVAGTRPALGGHALLGVRSLAATGVAPDGAIGERSELVPIGEIGGEVRWPLGAHLQVRLAAGLEVAIVDQRFTIDGATVLEIGRVRGTGTLSFILSTL